MISSETPSLYFADRYDAGRQLATKLISYAGRPDTIVLGLPRGGVPVAYEIARCLSLPLDVFVVRKLGAPGQQELALGAIASGGIRSLNQRIISSLNISPAMLRKIESEEQMELSRREALYRNQRPLNLTDKIVIVVDDGLATGATMRAACIAISHLSPAEIIAAVPVGSAQTRRELEAEMQRVNPNFTCIMLSQPEDLSSVGSWYSEFSQITDDEVRRLLASTCQ